MAQSPDLRGLDQVLGILDNGQYLPQLIEANSGLIEEISSFSQAYGTKASGTLNHRKPQPAQHGNPRGQ